jgi:hypothetical protein
VQTIKTGKETKNFFFISLQHLVLSYKCEDSKYKEEIRAAVSKKQLDFLSSENYIKEKQYKLSRDYLDDNKFLAMVVKYNDMKFDQNPVLFELLEENPADIDQLDLKWLNKDFKRIDYKQILRDLLD